MNKAGFLGRFARPARARVAWSRLATQALDSLTSSALAQDKAQAPWILSPWTRATQDSSVVDRRFCPVPDGMASLEEGAEGHLGDGTAEMKRRRK